MGNPATGAAAGFEQMAADATNEVEEAGIIASFTGLGMLLGSRGGSAVGVAIGTAVGGPAGAVVGGVAGQWVGTGIGFSVGLGGATIFNNYLDGDYDKVGAGSRDMPLSLVSHTTNAANHSSTWNYSTIEGMKVGYAMNGAGNVTSMSMTGNGNDNYLAGNSAKNIIIGNGGKDSIIGRGGNDDMQGNAGIDTITGGNGHDTFRFYGGPANTANRDSVTDFSRDDTLMNFHKVKSYDGVDQGDGYILLNKMTDTADNHVYFAKPMLCVDTLAAVNTAVSHLEFDGILSL